jgi:hypothetical protein
MIMGKGQLYRCQNPDCAAEVRVEKPSIDGFSQPICCCGAEMNRLYEPPALRKIKATPEIIAALKQKKEE